MPMDAGEFTVRMRVQNPPTPVTNGDGDFTAVPVDADPAYLWASIRAANQRAMERLVSSTIASEATHLIKTRFHPDVTTQTVLTWTDRAGRSHTANVIYVDDVESAGVELTVLGKEIVS